VESSKFYSKSGINFFFENSTNAHARMFAVI